MLVEETDVHREVQRFVAERVGDGEEGQEPAFLPPESIEEIEQLVDAFIGLPELIDAVETILIIAHALEVEKNSVQAAMKLIAIVERQKVLDAMKALNRKKDDERREDVGKTAKEFSKFAAKEQSNTAPKEDEEAPKGSLKLGALDFPKRM